MSAGVTVGPDLGYDGRRVIEPAQKGADMTQIRASKPADRTAIYRVESAAFGQKDEADLVERLEAAGRTVFSLVAEKGDEIVGHILFTSAKVAGGQIEQDIVCLAPVAVYPDHQNEGIGAALIRAGIELCQKAGHARMFVLGHPAYYPRFGFERAGKYGISYSEEAPPEAVMVMALIEGGLQGVSGVIKLAPEFGGM